MKVVAIVPMYPPDSRVGAWLATHEFLTHLAARGHQVAVWRYNANFAAGYEHEGVTVLDRLDDITLSESDVIVSHLGDARESKPLAKRYGKPLVRMVHGHVQHGADKLEGDALAVFNSEACRAENGWDGPSIVCHPPIDIERFRTGPGDKVTLVNLCPEKGGDLFPLIAKTLPDVAFLGVKGGYGTQRTRIVPNVEYIDRTENMVDDVYSRTRVLLMPSERETWGMVAGEAMASGIPVIAHPTEGLRECLGPAGIWADRDDVDTWIAEIRRLRQPSRWAAASKKALKRSNELDHNASLDRFADAVEALVGVPA